MLPTTIKESTVKQEVDFVKKQKKFDQPTTSKKCYFCGGVYDPCHQGSARRRSCSKFGKTNYFACVCCSKPIDKKVMMKIHENQED